MKIVMRGLYGAAYVENDSGEVCLYEPSKLCRLSEDGVAVNLFAWF